MYHHEPQTREETYAVMPRRVGKEGSGGYGMGVAPHAGYDQTPTVVGLRDHYMPQNMDELAPMTLKHMRKANPTEFDRLRLPSPYATTHKGVEKFFTEAVERQITNEHVQMKNPTIAPSDSSGFASSQGYTGGAHGGYGAREAPEAYHPRTLKDMKTKNPVEFWDIIRSQDRPTTCDTQTTSSNFQMLGTHPNDPRYYWTSKTAVGLM